MNVERKLRRWREAGLIDDTTYARIADFLRQAQQPVAMYALIGLGASTVGLGLISLVAANWELIPRPVKLGVDLALGVALALLLRQALARQSRLAREALVTLYYAFTLASLALVGQLYQLNTPTYQALVTWCVATLPLVLLGESRFLGALYTAGLVTTHGFALEALFDALDAAHSRALAFNLGACVVFISPLPYLLLGFLPWLIRERPQYAFCLRACGATAIVLGGCAIPMIWYDSIGPAETLHWALLVTLPIALAGSALVTRLLRQERELPLLALQLVLPAAWLMLAISTAFERNSADFIGALLQIAWLAGLAFVSYRARRVRLFNTFTRLLALRILIVYFEVFGSLLDTGVGLVVGGALTLLGAWWWQRKMRQLAARASALPEMARVE